MRLGGADEFTQPHSPRHPNPVGLHTDMRILSLTLLLACAPTDDGTVRTPPTAAEPTSTSTDPTTGTGTATGGTTPTSTTDRRVAEVGHVRELRGIWIATVWNIDWPGAQGQSAEDHREQLTELMDIAQSLGFNAVFLQVRPEGDALYDSPHEPWSRWLTGTQGVDPGWDPLAEATQLAHGRGLELHAWLNPYRARASTAHALAGDHFCSATPEACHTYGTQTWMDPGDARVRANALAVAADLVARYDLDGLHLDDYFYPYPDGTPFPDDATWGAYTAAGGPLDRDDWRRDNVNQLVAGLAAIVADTPVRFGISPFGIYRPGEPPGISGLDQYAELYSDPVAWVEAGHVDYLAPQLYWPTTQDAQAFEPLLDWWSTMASEGGVATFAGTNLTNLGSSPVWSLDEYRAQIELSRAYTAQGSAGNIHFSANMLDDAALEALFTELYAAPALTPVLGGHSDDVVSPPETIEVTDGVLVEHPDDLRAYTVYADAGDAWRYLHAVPGDATKVFLDPGNWAIAAVDRYGVESTGVVVTVREP